MSVRFFRWLRGYVQFLFTGGFAEGFLNDCFSGQIDIKEIVVTDEGITAVTSFSQYKKLHRIALKNGGKVKIQRKAGLPFFLVPLKSRWGFYFGFVAFIFIVSYLSGFVWNIEITGISRINEADICAFLKSNGFSSGTKWSETDKEKLEFAMMGNFSDIAWVHINQIGTTARVEINETTRTPEMKEDDDRVELRVFREEISLVVSRKQTVSEKTGEKVYKTLGFFNLEIPLYFSKEDGIGAEETENLILFNQEIPIYIKTDTRQFFQSQEKNLSDEELIAVAGKRLYSQRDLQLADYEIINENITTQLDENSCVITGSFICRSSN